MAVVDYRHPEIVYPEDTEGQAADGGYELTEQELEALLDDEIANSICFENDIGLSGGTGEYSRSDAIDYYNGIMRDLPAEPGWSRAVSKDVSDTIDFILPGLMRIFAGPGQIVKYGPRTSNDVQAAKQATDYVNFIFWDECDGYRVLETTFQDALQVRNGIVKAYWDWTPEVEYHEFTSISEEQMAILMHDPDVEVIGVRQGIDIITDPATGQQTQVITFDVKVEHILQRGKLVVEAVPPEDFGMSAAKTIPASRCVWHRTIYTRSDLIQKGYPRDIIDDLPAHSRRVGGEVVDRGDGANDNRISNHKAMEDVEVYECYCLYDVDGDGVAERIKILVAGGKGSRKILPSPEGDLFEPWDDDLPFYDIVTKPVPHRWMGRSVADDTIDIQQQKTAVLRGGLNNIYLVNMPEREVVQNMIYDFDEVKYRQIGNTIRVKTAGAIRDLTTPFVGDKVMLWMEQLDKVRRTRTGVSEATQALDSTAMDPQTATAEQLQHDASYAKVELIARNIAELSLKPLFAGLLKLIVKHQDRPKVIRLRDQFIEMDPRSWNAKMDVTINVGLGTGSRERDLAILKGVAAEQDKVVQAMGPDNPVVPPSVWIETRQKMVEAAGLRNPDAYIKPVSDQEFSQWFQQKQQGQADPKAQEMQAKMQLEQMKAQADIALAQLQAQLQQQTEQAKLTLQAQLEGAKAEAQQLAEQAAQERSSQFEQIKLERQAAIEQAQAQADIEVQQAKAAWEIERDRMKFEFDKQLKIMDVQMKAAAEQQRAEEADRRQQEAANNPQPTEDKNEGLKAIAAALSQPKKVVIDNG